MERKPFPSETQERFIVRFPDGMRDRIADVAKMNNRSMNAEIVARLQASMATDGAVGQQAFERGFETTVLQREIERLTKLLEDRAVEVRAAKPEPWSEKEMERFAAKAAQAAVAQVLTIQASGKITGLRGSIGIQVVPPSDADAENAPPKKPAK